MSNFNTPSVSQPRSNLSLGGEMTNRDKMEANKYKMSGLANLHKKKYKQLDKPRPKSTPAALQAASPEQGYEPPASAPPGIRPRCDRFHEVERDFPGRKNMLESHLPVKKTRAVHHHEQEHLSVKDYELAPGMTMSKSKSKVAVTIHTGLFDAPPKRAESVRSFDHERNEKGTLPREVIDRKRHVVPKVQQRQINIRLGNLAKEYHNVKSVHYSGYTPLTRLQDALILQLQQQIADLSLYLEEERLNHRATKERAAMLMQEKIEELEEQHRHDMQELQDELEEQIEELKTLQKKQLEQERTAAHAAQSRLKGEVEFLQGAFEAYKGNVAQEMEEKWAKRESDLKLQFQEEIDEALQDQRQEWVNEREREKKAMNREFQRQLNVITQDHRREMDTLHKKFSTAAVDMENMKKSFDKLKSVEGILAKKSEQLETATAELKKTKLELQDTKIRLAGFEEHFHDKIQEVDDKYKQRMHNLMGENADLRRRYMQKCDELFTEKSNTEVQRVEKLSNAKETMQMLIHVRNRTNVSMACSDPALDNQPKAPKLRPASAPVTKKEEITAKLSAGETDHITNPIEKRDKHDDKLLRGRPPSRPNTSHSFRSAPPPNAKRALSMLDSFGYGSMQSM